MLSPSSAGRAASAALGSSGDPTPSGPPLRARVRACDPLVADGTGVSPRDVVAIGVAVLEEARGWIGTLVKWEASLKGVGCDCRGLLAGSAREVGLPEAGAIEATIGGYARKIDQVQLIAGLDRLFDRVPAESARAGDVLAFRLNRTVQHLAIHAGNGAGGGRMVHAYMGDPALVCEVPIGRFWGNRLAGVWRWKEVPVVTQGRN